MASNCILVVDDQRINRDALAELLRDEGYQAVTAGDAATALSALGTNEIDLVLLDVGMPGMSGLELLETLRRTRSPVELPVIMVTAVSDSEAVVAALARGASDYVTKPVDLAVLLARIRTQLELCRLSRLKDEFLRIASHDLKNPLTVIQFGIDSLTDEFPLGSTVTDEARTYFDSVRQSAMRMKRIIGDFLDLGALREGRLVLDRAAFDLHTLVAQSIEHNSVYAARKAIRLALETGISQAIVQGDGARITQVIDNLVSNAIKFTPNGGAVLLRIDDQLPGVRIEVRDTGPGLTKDDLAGLFVPHRRGASRPTGNESSTGLGLALCKQLVELHGGHIGAQNATEGGAVFWFELPRG